MKSSVLFFISALFEAHFLMINVLIIDWDLNLEFQMLVALRVITTSE